LHPPSSIKEHPVVMDESVLVDANIVQLKDHKHENYNSFAGYFAGSRAIKPGMCQQ